MTTRTVHPWRRVVLAALLLAVGFLPPRPTHAAEGVGALLERVDTLLGDWRIAEAADIAEKLYRDLPDIPAVQAAAGKVKFYQSDYVGAVTLLEQAASAFKGADEEAAGNALDGAFLELVRATRDATEGFIATESAHFSFRARPGKDQVLAPYALEALEAAYERIGGDFQWRPKEKIVVEVYSSAKALAQVSTLTEKEIETSGTIAICKFNRLMITSPRALLRGYAWLDTLAHEYTHLIISQKSHNTVGIWLHEGLAKYSESRWTEQDAGLSHWQENLLAKAIKSDKLITFEQMHPSMAKLPSQNDTALAFAEVFTVVEYLHKGGPTCARAGNCPPGTPQGFAVTNAIIEHLRDGESDEQAIASVLGASFDHFKKDWLKYLKARPTRHTPGAEAPRIEFKKGKRHSDDEDRDEDLDHGMAPEVKRYARLGNLLRQAGRPKAAAMQYERAVAKAGRFAPALHNRLASAYLEAGDDARALAALKSVEQSFPDYPQTHIQLGRVHYKRAEWKQAAQSYLMANRQNPFNPEIHAALADIYSRLGDKELAQREARAFHILNEPDPERRGTLADEKDPNAATLQIETNPFAQLVIDDVDVGLMTPAQVRLSPGEHKLLIKNPALAIHREIPITLKPGEQQRMRLNLLQP
ncbi:MAG: tetratricopeptide repeat protein [Myxococcota bacterium]